MSNDVTISRPYAKAIFEYALEVKELDKWSKMLAVASNIIENDDICGLLHSSSYNNFIIFTIEFAIKNELDIESKEFKNFLNTLVTRKRLKFIPGIFTLFTYYRSKYDLPSPVEVISAFELTSEEVLKITNAIEKKVGKSVSLKLEIDPSLIAGIIIKTDDYIIDGSTRYQLDQLASTMCTGS